MMAVRTKQNLTGWILGAAQKGVANFYAFIATHPGRNCTPILIYQMGKVGSRSVYKSLKRIMPYGSVFFVHFLSDGLKRYKKIHEDAGVFPAPYHIELGLALNKRLKQHKGKIRYKIISMVREPIARQVSDAFQNPELLEKDIKGPGGLIDAEKCIDCINEMFSKHESFDYVFNWFDTELKQVFGIDVFSIPFDKDAGWQIYNGDRADALIIRLEDLSRVGEIAIASFIGLPGKVGLAKENIRSKTQDGFVYNDIKRKIKVDRSICEYVYSSKFARHFYSENEIEKMMQRWMSNG